MSDNQDIVGASSSSGTKRGPQQEELQYGEPAAKVACRRKRSDNDNGYGLEAIENPNGNSNNGSSDGAWSEEIHRDFVASIFEIGLKNASPAVILENMTQKVETITSERVKSKLQKYRNNKNKEKSKNAFMMDYCEFLQKIQSIQAEGIGDTLVIARLLEDLACRYPSQKSLLLSGDVAGDLTYCVMKESDQTKNASGSNHDSIGSSSVLPTNVLKKGAREYVDNYAGCPIQFPILTEIEKKSSLGIAMTFIAGLFLTMSQHLTRERARAQTIGLKKPPEDDNKAQANI